MDVSALATIAAAGIGVIAGMAWLTLPRWPEDYFDLSMDELGSYTASGTPYPAPLAGGQEITVSLEQPECGRRDTMASETSPPPIIGSDRILLSGPESGGRAVQQPIPSEGAPVRSVSSPCRGLPGDTATDGAVLPRWTAPSLFISSRGTARLSRGNGIGRRCSE